MGLVAGLLFCGSSWVFPLTPAADGVPLPEHPRPDWERWEWRNLNGSWEFRFDPKDEGLREQWYGRGVEFPLHIRVPFPWGAPLSGVDDEADVAWYRRDVQIPDEWSEGRIFLIIGAADWETTAWLDGRRLGVHRGGYIPFEFELTELVRPGTSHRLVLRIDDRARPFKLEGKQGYGNARGIWQTVYLERRGRTYLREVRFVPDARNGRVRVEGRLSEPVGGGFLRLRFHSGNVPEVSWRLEAGTYAFSRVVEIPHPRLWSLEDPFLYEVELELGLEDAVQDRVRSYFGLRDIGVGRVPGHDYTYVTLNGKPIYLQMTLDQAYHPEGYYTFPSDEFVRDEILRSLRLGLNGMRVHVKTALPRKLYWADRLGMLIMADVPNSWGEPTPEMREEVEKTFAAMVRRDFNHPAIFSWVLFNETWGLMHKDGGYLPETQAWVESLYRRAKQMDPTRLVEDNSPNRRDHVATDLNTWHAYLPGYRWEAFLTEVERESYPGSPWNFVPGRVQGTQPVLNSECGNVWGYEGSTGDVDWSWDYHQMLNAFRRHMKIGGWLYTEHHDVINEWNGYYRYDRSEKETGLGELVPGMSLRDWHGPVYVAVGREVGSRVRPGEEVEIPLHLSLLEVGSRRPVRLVVEYYGWDDLGRRVEWSGEERRIELQSWQSLALPPIRWTAPDATTIVVVAVRVVDAGGGVLHRNFGVLSVEKETPAYERRPTAEGTLHLVRVEPDDFVASRWEDGFSASVLGGLKVNGARHGFFEYEFALPRDLVAEEIVSGFFLAELSSRSVLGRDVGEGSMEGDYMRGGGTHDPGRNPNSYPMTDGRRHPSLVRIVAEGRTVGRVYLPDDPADHRGLLSWLAQPRDGHLYEAGTYGELVRVAIPAEVVRQALAAGRLRLRLEVDEAMPGGLAVYGRRFGRYPVDPTLGIVTTR